MRSKSAPAAAALLLPTRATPPPGRYRMFYPPPKFLPIQRASFRSTRTVPIVPASARTGLKSKPGIPAMKRA